MADTTPVQTTTATSLQFQDWCSMAGLSFGDRDDSAALLYATAHVRKVCGRDFIMTPADGKPTEVRTYPGSGKATITIDDCLQVAGVSMGGGAVSTAGYKERGYNGKLPYLYLDRFAASPFMFAQYAEFAPWLGVGIWPEGYDVAVTGLWGYAATVPDEVVRATCIYAASWMARPVASMLGADQITKSYSAGAIRQDYVVGTEVIAALNAFRAEADHDLRSYKRWD
jgi:hypothetical protein